MNLKLENICVPFRSSPKRLTTQGDLRTSDILYRHPPQSLLAGLLNKVAVPGLNHRDITPPRLTRLPPLLSPVLQQQRPGVGAIPGAQPATVSIHRHTEWLAQHDSYPTKLPLVKKLPL